MTHQHYMNPTTRIFLARLAQSTWNYHKINIKLPPKDPPPQNFNIYENHLNKKHHTTIWPQVQFAISRLFIHQDAGGRLHAIVLQSCVSTLDVQPGPWGERWQDMRWKGGKKEKLPVFELCLYYNSIWSKRITVGLSCTDFNATNTVHIYVYMGTTR